MILLKPCIPSGPRKVSCISRATHNPSEGLNSRHTLSVNDNLEMDCWFHIDLFRHSHKGIRSFIFKKDKCVYTCSATNFSWLLSSVITKLVDFVLILLICLRQRTNISSGPASSVFWIICFHGIFPPQNLNNQEI